MMFGLEDELADKLEAARRQLGYHRQREERLQRDHKLLTATLKRAVKCVEAGVPENIPGIVQAVLGKLEATC
jgi:hypothetical protein